MPTEQDIANVDADIVTIGDVATGGPALNGDGTTTNRLGVHIKTLQKVIGDLATSDVGSSAAALINQRIESLITTGKIPCSAAQGSSVNVWVVTPATALSEPVANGNTLEFVVPSTPTGPVNIQGAWGSLLLYEANNSTLLYKLLKAGQRMSIVYNVPGNRFAREQPAGQMPLAELGTISTSDGAAAIDVVTASGQPNAPPGYTLLFVTTASDGPGAETLGINGGPQYPIKKVDNTILSDGDLQGLSAIEIVWTGEAGNFWRLVSPQPTPAPRQDDSFLPVVAASRANPFGVVTKNTDGTPNRAVITPTFLGRGSSVFTSNDPSVGREGGCPPQSVPLKILCDEYNAAFGPGVQSIYADWAHGGHTISQAPSQYQEAVDAYAAAHGGNVMPAPGILLDGFGMNDASYYQTATGEGFFNGGLAYYEADIKAHCRAGSTVIVCTTAHQNTTTYPYAEGMGTSLPMQFPYAEAAPVPPEHLTPPPSQRLRSMDLTGSGQFNIGDTLTRDVNRQLRAMVRRLRAQGCKVILADIEYAWFRYGIEVHGLALLYDTGETVHPNALGHACSTGRVMREIALAMADGMGDKWWFRGDGAAADNDAKLTPFQMIMLPAMRAAKAPRRTPLSTAPVIAVFASTSPPAELSTATAIPWNATGMWRVLGGFTQQYGSNPFFQTLAQSPTGNGAPFTSCTHGRIQFVFNGQNMYFLVRGNGTNMRFIADGAYVSTAFTVLPNDGNFYIIRLAWGAAATRNVEIEHDGSLVFGGGYVLPGNFWTAPTDKVPRWCIGGTSVAEASFGWISNFARRLGIDVWDTGVGSVGVLAFNTSNGRVKMRDRSIDYTGHTFDAFFGQHVINDTLSTLYADTSYATVELTMRDEYRRNLDLWAAAQGEKPWIATGYWPVQGIDPLCWPIADGIRNAIDEYDFAKWIDPFNPAGYVWPMINGAVPQTYYFDPSDPTHPIEPGGLRLADIMVQPVKALIFEGQL